MGLKGLEVAKTLDVKGQICPYPMIHTREALKKLDSGQVLEVLSDHQPAAENTIPALCKKMNCETEVEFVDGCYRLLIRKP